MTIGHANTMLAHTITYYWTLTLVQHSVTCTIFNGEHYTLSVIHKATEFSKSSFDNDTIHVMPRIWNNAFYNGENDE